MHPKFQRADEWSRKLIGAAIEVHREKGPGLLEPIYEKCLLRELFLQKIPAQNNFHAMKLVHGLHRLILPGADGSGFGAAGRQGNPSH